MASVLTVTINPALDVTAIVDEVVPDHKLRCRTPIRDPGGGGINVARTVHRLGGSVTPLYATGGDAGKALVDLLAAEGIVSETFSLQDVTRENLTVTEQCSSHQYRFILPGAEFTEYEWRAFLDLVGMSAIGKRYLIASGSLAPGVPDDFYARCAKIARSSGSEFVLDCSGLPLALALEEHVHMIKPSLREFEALMGKALPDTEAQIDAGRDLIGSGKLDIPALSLGGRGALLVTANIALKVFALRVTALSTVGAGDSFLGGIVWGLAAGYSIEDAAHYGVAASAATLLQPGTRLCAREDVDRLVSEVQSYPPIRFRA